MLSRSKGGVPPPTLEARVEVLGKQVRKLTPVTNFSTTEQDVFQNYILARVSVCRDLIPSLTGTFLLKLKSSSCNLFSERAAAGQCTGRNARILTGSTSVRADWHQHLRCLRGYPGHSIPEYYREQVSSHISLWLSLMILDGSKPIYITHAERVSPVQNMCAR